MGDSLLVWLTIAHFYDLFETICGFYGRWLASLLSIAHFLDLFALVLRFYGR